MSTGIKSEEKTTGTQYSACLSVTQWISGAGWRLPSSRRWKGATRPPKTSRCDYGFWHLARALSIKQIWMELDRASAATPEQAGCAVSQYEGCRGLEPLLLLLSGFVSWALWTGAIERYPGQQQLLSQSITTPWGELEVHSHRGRIGEREASTGQHLENNAVPVQVRVYLFP